MFWKVKVFLKKRLCIFDAYGKMRKSKIKILQYT